MKVSGSPSAAGDMIEFHVDSESLGPNAEVARDRICVLSRASGDRSAMAALVAIEIALSPVLNLSGGVGFLKTAESILE
jgi:rhodanese-related sulfurtransferase